MLGLDLTALLVGFAAGAVLWGGLSFLLDWIVGKIKARNAPDYVGEIARLNGRVLELESMVQDTVSTAEYQIGELQASNDALQAELAEREQNAMDLEPMRQRMAELEARAEAAESSLDEAKVTLLAAERALLSIKERAAAHLNGSSTNGHAAPEMEEPAAPEAHAREDVAREEAEEPYALA